MLSNISTKYKIILVVVILILTLVFILKPSPISNVKTAELMYKPFSIEVNALGEVHALNYKEISIPTLLKNKRLRIWTLKITDIIAEGTHVKKGDYVASLDPTDVENSLKKILDNVDDYQHTLDNAVLDSTIALVGLRDAIIDAKDDITENEIKVEQSKFESKAIQRQAEITLEQAQLILRRKKRNLNKEINKHKVKIRRAKKRLKEASEIKDKMEKLISLLNIKSPADGMVIYARGADGKKIKVNGVVGSWDPTIATIPDLNSMVSESIVKEIDIAKVKIGQKVNISINAFPGRNFKGVVYKIANIGQPLEGTEMNGFKVLIHIDNKGAKVLPNMTTSNNIITTSCDSALVLPRKVVFGNDSTEYVFKKSKGLPIKTYVKTSGENKTLIRIISGLSEGDKVLLKQPKKFK